MKKVSILFVCLGNICRSPMAEAVFKHIVSEEGFADNFVIDSCGTGSWHIGERPHRGTAAILKKNQIEVGEQLARQLQDEDYEEFDYIVAMDQSNLADIEDLFGRDREKIFCLREYDFNARDLDVPDPYYDRDGEGFDRVFDIIDRSCRNFLKRLLEDFSQ